MGEARLVEILESICGKSDRKCNDQLPDLEDHIERWWAKRYSWLDLGLILTIGSGGWFGLGWGGQWVGGGGTLDLGFDFAGSFMRDVADHVE